MSELESLERVIRTLLDERDEALRDVRKEVCVLNEMVGRLTTERDQADKELARVGLLHAQAAGERDAVQHHLAVLGNELTRVETERDEFHAVCERLRERVHKVADECQRRSASVQSERDRLVALMAEAARRHGDEMEAAGQPRYAHISQLGQATLASILAERDTALLEVGRLATSLLDVNELVGQLTIERDAALLRVDLSEGNAARLEWVLGEVQADRDEARAELTKARHDDDASRVLAEVRRLLAPPTTRRSDQRLGLRP